MMCTPKEHCQAADIGLCCVHRLEGKLLENGQHATKVKYVANTVQLEWTRRASLD